MFEAGTVLLYPYLWKRQFQKGATDSKDRTCCIAMRMTTSDGIEIVTLVAISDRAEPGFSVLEIPHGVKKKCGLDSRRKAYLHLDEVNVDSLKRSYFLAGGPKILGQVGDEFLEILTLRLTEAVKKRLTAIVDRRF